MFSCGSFNFVSTVTSNLAYCYCVKVLLERESASSSSTHKLCSLNFSYLFFLVIAFVEASATQADLISSCSFSYAAKFVVHPYWHRKVDAVIRGIVGTIVVTITLSSYAFGFDFTKIISFNSKLIQLPVFAVVITITSSKLVMSQRAS